jgi:hypothetical protein
MSHNVKLACLLDGHQAGYADVRNQGLSFSQCRLCGRDLIRMRGGWKPPPKHFRIVWRPARAPVPEPAPLRLVRNLPVPGRSGFGRRWDLRRSAALAWAGAKAALEALVRRGGSVRWPRPPRQFPLPMPLPVRRSPAGPAWRIIGSPLEDLSSFAAAICRVGLYAQRGR